jgi:Lon protease-like protein
MTLPLYIFEDRYRRMIHDCLQSDRYLGIFLLRKGWEQAPEPQPYDVGGFGQIVRAVKLPAGNYEIVVRGLGKARILSYVQEIPYRRAVIELLEDEGEDSPQLRAQAATMVERLKKILALRPEPRHRTKDPPEAPGKPEGSGVRSGRSLPGPDSLRAAIDSGTAAGGGAIRPAHPPAES